MNSLGIRRLSLALAMLVLGSVLLTACGGTAEDTDTEVAVAVALTQTAAAEQPPTPTYTPPPTHTPEPATAGDTSAAAATPAQTISEPALDVLPGPVYFIDAAGQIARLEADGQTHAQITNEAEPVTDFDVSPADGHLAYVSGNSLIEAGRLGENPVIRVAGEPLADDDYEGRITREIMAPRFSPDGVQIAYGLNGVNLIESGQSAGVSGFESIQPSDPYPAPDATSRPEQPPRFFWPDSWSPDGTRLLLNFAWYPEGGGLIIKEVESDKLVEVTGEAGFPCCNPSWSRDGSALYYVDQTFGYPASNLWRINAGTGGGIKLVEGVPEAGQDRSVQVSSPHETETEDLLAFVSTVSDPSQPAQFTMHQVRQEDGLTKLSSLRNDAYTADDILWADDDSGALIASIVSREQFPATGQLIWLPTDGASAALALPATGRLPRWGHDLNATASSEAAPPSPEQIEVQNVAANNWGIDLETSSQTSGIQGVHAFQLQAATGEPMPLWTAHTYGGRSFSPEQFHTVGIFAPDAGADGGWREVAKIELTGESGAQDIDPTPDYLAVGSVQQEFVEPNFAWLGVEGGVGAHGGTYQLLRFDGATISSEVSGFSASPGVGSFADLNGDGLQELLMDATEYYVFCYACGVRRVHFDVWRWDGEQMTPVVLTALPESESAPDELKTINEQALAFAGADLWKDALATVDNVAVLDTLDPESESATTFGWNSTYIRLNTQAKRAVLNDDEAGYPILENVFYGDYDAAVDLMRGLSADQIFTATTPLVIGTVAEGWEGELSSWLTKSADAALDVKPGLAPAYFLRGWGTYLVKPDDESILADVTRAADLAPDDALYAESLAYLGGTAATAPPAETPTPVSADATATPSPTATSAVTETTSVEVGQLAALSQLNVRGGPGTEYPIVGALNEGDTAQVTGRNDEGDSTWWQIEFAGGEEDRGWVIGDPALVAVDDAIDVPEIEAPAEPTPAPTTAAAPVSGSGRIFFSIQEADGGKNVYVANVGSGDTPTQVVDLAVQPNLQPGGQRLAFHSTRDDMLGLGGFDLDTGLRVRFAKNIEDAFPSWNGDGNRLVFASNREGDRKWRIYVTWADSTSDAIDLGFGQDPDWHPSQDLIVFKGCDNAGGSCGLWTMGADGAGRAPLTSIPSDSRPVWTPDGSAVVFMSNERDGNWDIYRVDVASGTVTRLTENGAATGANDGMPAVSPDGGSVAFFSDRDGSWSIWSVPSTGGAAQLVTATGSTPSDWREHGIDWAP